MLNPCSRVQREKGHAYSDRGPNVGAVAPTQPVTQIAPIHLYALIYYYL